MAQEHDEEDEEDGLPSLEARYGKYCDRVEGSADWGGQLELRALAQALARRITVYSVGMPPVVMGADAPPGGPFSQFARLTTSGRMLGQASPSSVAGGGWSGRGATTAGWLLRREQC